jgi:hypothetical protein
MSRIASAAVGLLFTLSMSLAFAGNNPADPNICVCLSTVTLPSGMTKGFCHQVTEPNINDVNSCVNYCAAIGMDQGIWATKSEALTQCGLANGPNLVHKGVAPNANYREMRLLHRVGDYWDYDCGDAVSGRMLFSIGHVETRKDADQIGVRVCRELLSSSAP